jgi:hypothetical protein
MIPNLDDLSDSNVNLGEFGLVGITTSSTLLLSGDFCRLLFLFALLGIGVRFLLLESSSGSILDFFI